MPGFLGVGVGGYAAEAMSNAKNAVFRELTVESPDNHPNSDDNHLRNFEQRILRCVNSLGLGPMGGGGKITTMGVYLERRGTQTALASVAVCQQCWASRGSEALIRQNQVNYVTPHLEKDDVPALKEELSQQFARLEIEENVHELNTPIKTQAILKLRVGDIVYLSGVICTSRDRAHRRMIEKTRAGKGVEIPQEITNNGVIYYCGPVIAKESDRWLICAAGPTTSSRFTADAAFLVENGVIKVVIGKGDMGREMVNALKGRGVYLRAVGGCAVTYRKTINQNDVKWLDLGYPEAVWVLDVTRFGPLVVGIDSLGNSLVGSVMEEVYANARRIYRQEGLDPHRRYAQYPQTTPGLSLEELIERARMS